jgi:hypothetical protein
MRADLRSDRVRRILFGRLAVAAAIAGFATVAAAQSPQPANYEAKVRLLIVHKKINLTAAPIRVDAAAATHAAMIASPRIAEIAAQKYRLSELDSLNQLPPGDVAWTISGSTTALGKPSSEATNTSVVEVRFYSAGVADPTAVTKALCLAYEEFLASPEENVEASIVKAERYRERLEIQCEELKRSGKSIELAEAQRRLYETLLELPTLRLKARVGEFNVVVLEEPIQAVKLAPR